MANMQTCCAGVRKLNQAVELGLGAAGFSSVRLELFPLVLPLLLYCCKIVLHFLLIPFNNQLKMGAEILHNF